MQQLNPLSASLLSVPSDVTQHHIMRFLSRADLVMLSVYNYEKNISEMVDLLLQTQKIEVQIGPVERDLPRRLFSSACLVTRKFTIFVRNSGRN